MNEKRSWVGFADDWPDWVRRLVIPFVIAALLAWTTHTLWIVLVSKVWPALTNGTMIAQGILWYAIPGWIAMATRVKPAGIIITILYGLLVIGWMGYNDSVAYRLGQLKQVDAAYFGWFSLYVLYEAAKYSLYFWVLRQFEKRFDFLAGRPDRKRPASAGSI